MKKKFGFDFDEWERILLEWGNKREKKFIGSKLILFNEINSTNTYIKENLSELRNGSIVISRIQTSGKGQKARKWKSNKGGLYFSLKLEFDESIHIQPFWVIATIAIALVDLLKSLGLDTSIKWPNDVLVTDKKVCGIIAENVYSKNKISLIIGIGININNSLGEIIDDFPNLQGKISKLSNHIPDVNENFISQILTKIGDDIENQLEELNLFNPKDMKEKYMYLSQLNGKIVDIEYIETKEKFSGTIKNILDTGSILVELRDGKLKEFTSGTIKVRKKDEGTY